VVGDGVTQTFLLHRIAHWPHNPIHRIDSFLCPDLIRSSLDPQHAAHQTDEQPRSSRWLSERARGDEALQEVYRICNGSYLLGVMNRSCMHITKGAVVILRAACAYHPPIRASPDVHAPILQACFCRLRFQHLFASVRTPTFHLRPLTSLASPSQSSSC
jgi:hypothetical protein